MENPDSFDAKLVALIEGGMSLGDDKNFLVEHNDEVRMAPVRILASANRLNQLRELGVNFLLKSEEQLLATRIEASALEADLVEVLLEGRLQLSLVLDSPGGPRATGDTIVRAIDHIKKKGGSVSTYAGKEASSAAAAAWEQGNRRFVLPGSQMLWHTGEVTALQGNEKEKSEDRDAIEAFLSRAQEPYRTQFLETIAADVDSRHEISMTGAEAYAAGLCEPPFETVLEMEQHFRSESGWGRAYGGPLNGYWDLMEAGVYNLKNDVLRGLLLDLFKGES